MDQAQGAIDTAKAAGADRYAPDEYRAATDALKRSREAVDQRDYRLALNNALDSRERALTAARLSVDTKAQLRGDVERTMAEVAALMAEAHARVAAAEKSRASRLATRRSADALAKVEADVQKAGAAARRDDYAAAQKVLANVKQRIAASLGGLERPAASPAGRRRR